MQGTSTPQERNGCVPGEDCRVLPPSRTATGLGGPLSTGECPAHVISHFPERPSPAGPTSCVPSQAPTDMSAAGLPTLLPAHALPLPMETSSSTCFRATWDSHLLPLLFPSLLIHPFSPQGNQIAFPGTLERAGQLYPSVLWSQKPVGTRR